MERAHDVLVGKLAIGRGLLSREAAVRCFHSSRGPLLDTAVTEGLIDAEQARALLATITAGSIVCRGTCGQRFPIDAEHALDRCGVCGGPLYASAQPASPSRVEPTQARQPEPEPPPTANEPAEAAIPHLNDLHTLPSIHIEGFDPTAPAAVEPTPAPVAPAPAQPAAALASARPEAADLAPARPEAADLASARREPGFAGTRPDSLPSAIPVRRAAAPATPAAPLTPGSPPGKSSIDETIGARKIVKEFTPFTIGSYEVLAPIGQGGMGSVFRARHKVLKQIVAIKILRIAAEKEEEERFQRECQAMVKLSHPSIVGVMNAGVVSSGEFAGKPYFVMEHVAGRDLGTWLKEAPRSPATIVALMAKIAEAVHYAHNQRIIHRDLKPQNVLVAFEGDTPKVCDFGLAKNLEAFSKLTRTGDIMGTPQYMPPEQIKGERAKIGPPTDVYALGATLYHMLTGSPPFNATKLHVLMLKVVKDHPLAPSQLNPGVTPALEAVVLKALAKEPIDRYHTAQDFGRALLALNL